MKLKNIIKFSTVFSLAVAVLCACNSGTSSSGSSPASTVSTVYIADAGYRNGNTVQGVPNVYQYTNNNGQLSFVSAIPAPGQPFIAPNGVAYNNGYVYVADTAAPPESQGAIFIYQASADGSLTYTGESLALPNGDAPEAIVFNPNGQYAYVAGWESGGVWQYTVAANGSLENPVQTPPVSGYNTTFAGSLSMNNSYLYTTCDDAACPSGNPDAINIFKIQTNGSVTAESQITFAGGIPTNVVFINGMVYAGAAGNQNLYYGNVNPDGSLNFISYYFDNTNYPSSNNYYLYNALAVFNGVLYLGLLTESQTVVPDSGLPFAFPVGSIGIPTNYDPALDIPLPTGLNQYGFSIDAIAQNY